MQTKNDSINQSIDKLIKFVVLNHITHIRENLSNKYKRKKSHMNIL